MNILLGVQLDKSMKPPMQPLRGTSEDLALYAIAGKMGSGKTSTAAFLACGWALKGGKFIICDPEGNASLTAQKQTLLYNIAPLEPAFKIKPAIEPQEIVNAVLYFGQILQDRIDGVATTNEPIMLMFDEYSTMMQSRSGIRDEVIPVLKLCGMRGRKHNMSVGLFGQVWHAEDSGGGPLRSLFTAIYIHNIRRETARLLTDKRNFPDTDELEPGFAWLSHRRGFAYVKIPFTTRSAVRAVRQRVMEHTDGGSSDNDMLREMLHAPVPTPPPAPAPASVPMPMPLPASGPDSYLSAEDARILHDFRNGTYIKDIVKEVWGITTKQQREYADKNKYVQDLVRGRLV